MRAPTRLEGQGRERPEVLAALAASAVGAVLAVRERRAAAGRTAAWEARARRAVSEARARRAVPAGPEALEGRAAVPLGRREG